MSGLIEAARDDLSRTTSSASTKADSDQPTLHEDILRLLREARDYRRRSAGEADRPL